MNEGDKRAFAIDSALIGAALAAIFGAGGATVLLGMGTTITGVSVLAAVLTASVLLGLWVGAPSARRGGRARDRWVPTAAAFALAGAVAAMWRVYSAIATSGFAQTLAVLAMVCAPAYAIGILLAAHHHHSYPYSHTGDGDDEHHGGGQTGVLVAGVLIGAAAGLLVVSLALMPWIGPTPILLATAIALLLPLLRDDAASGAIVESVLREVESPLATLRVTEVTFPGERQPERRLYLDDEQESGQLVRSGAPTLAYIAAAEAWLTRDPQRGMRHLFLGGGAYTLPRRIAERDPSARIDVVEVDVEVTRLAYAYFGLRPDHRIRTVNGDARAYLATAADAVYERIYLDVYTGSEAVPYHLVTREAFELMRERLVPGGAVGMNLIGITHGPESVRMWSVVRSLGAVFPYLALYTHLGTDFPDLQNLLLIGAFEEVNLPPTFSTFEQWPATEWRVPADAVTLRDISPPLK